MIRLYIAVCIRYTCASNPLVLCLFKVRANVFHNSHWVGSARMGPSSACCSEDDLRGSVLDEQLAVRGVAGLRVAGEAWRDMTCD